MITAQNKRRRQMLGRGEFLWLGGIGAAGVALLGGVVGCRGQGAASGLLSFVSYGGSYQEAQTKAWLDPFSEQRDIRILQESPTDYAKLRAMVESGQVTWDVVDVANDFGLESSADLLEPIDYSVVNKKPVLEGYANEYRVASMLYGNVLGYNTEQVNGTPQSWADFFDLEKFPGKRSLWKNPSETLEVASLGAGVPPEDLYPLDVELALGKLDTIRDQIVWWDTGAQAQQQLADGEVAMASIWNSRVPVAVEEGAPLKTQWNQHIATAAYLVVTKGTPNKKRAMERSS